MASGNALTVFGSFGFGNLGDELVPECFGHLMRAAGQRGEIRAMSRFANIPPGSAAPFPEKPALSDQNLGPLVLAGGGIIEPREMSCMNRAFALAGKVPGLRVATHAISVEPGVQFSWGQRRKLARQLRNIGPVMVRDNLSAEVLGTLVPGHPVRVIGDIALWLQPSEIPEEVARLVPERAIPVILSDVWETDDFLEWMAVELVDLARNLNAALLLLPISGTFGKDLAVHARLRDCLVRTAPDVELAFPAEQLPLALFSPGVVGTLLQQAPLVVSMRLHGCVMSYAVGTPFVGLTYHPKLLGFARTVGWPKALVPHKLPTRQSQGAYGYQFSDLAVERGDLSAAAEAVLGDADFSAVPYFRRLQIKALGELLEVLAERTRFRS